MIKTIEDNIIFRAFKDKLLDITYSVVNFNDNVENMESKYLWSFQFLADKLRNEADKLNGKEDVIFDQILEIFNNNVDENEFKVLMQMDLKELSEKVFNEWNVAIKAIRSTYEPEKFEML